MDGLLDKWMIGFEVKENLEKASHMQKLEKAFCVFLIDLFYSYVFDTQPSSHPTIQSPMGRQ